MIILNRINVHNNVHVFARKCARLMSAYKFASSNHYTTPHEYMHIVESLARGKSAAP